MLQAQVGLIWKGTVDQDCSKRPSTQALADMLRFWRLKLPRLKGTREAGQSWHSSGCGKRMDGHKVKDCLGYKQDPVSKKQQEQRNQPGAAQLSR